MFQFLIFFLISIGPGIKIDQATCSYLSRALSHNDTNLYICYRLPKFKFRAHEANCSSNCLHNSHFLKYKHHNFMLSHFANYLYR
jgi:hypothetical protein